MLVRTSSYYCYLLPRENENMNFLPRGTYDFPLGEIKATISFSFNQRKSPNYLASIESCS